MFKKTVPKKQVTQLSGFFFDFWVSCNDDDKKVSNFGSYVCTFTLCNHQIYVWIKNYAVSLYNEWESNYLYYNKMVNIWILFNMLDGTYFFGLYHILNAKKRNITNSNDIDDDILISNEY